MNTKIAIILGVGITLTLLGVVFFKPVKILGGSNPIVQTALGGTGTSSTPASGQILVGQSNGTYAPQATSTLGIITTETDPIFMAVSTSLPYLTTSTGLTVANFASANISQWTNDAGYVTTSGSGTPGGSDTQIQFNNGGAFGGSKLLTFNSSTNIFSVNGTASTTRIQVSTSTSANPGYGFLGDTNTGIFSDAEDVINILVGGTSGFIISKTALRITTGLVMKIIDGSNSSPSYGFANNSDTGMYYNSASSSVDFSIDSIRKFLIDSNGSKTIGTSTATCFTTDGTNCITGGAGTNYWQDSGTVLSPVTSTRIVSSSIFYAAAGAVTIPSYSFSNDTNTGLYNLADTLVITLGATDSFGFTASGMTLYQSTNRIVNQYGSASSPSYTFNGDNNTGLYRANTDIIGLSTGGISKFFIDSAGRTIINTTSTGADAMLYVKGSSTNHIAAFYTSSSAVSMCAVAGGAVGFGTCSPSGQVEYMGNGTQVDVYWSNPSAATTTLRLVGASGANYFQSATNTAVSGSAADINFTSMFAGATWAKFDKDGQIFFPQAYDDTVGATNRDLYIDNTGKIGYVSSYRASKKNIRNVEQAETNFISNLSIKHYDYQDESKGTNQIGMIAEEVAEICPQCVSYRRSETKVLKPSPTDPDKMIEVIEYGTTTEPETVNYSSPYMISSMIAKIQDLEARIEALESGQPLGSVKESWWDKLLKWLWIK